MSDDMRIASGLVEQQRWDDAHRILTEILADTPDSHRGWCLLAACHQGGGDWGAMLIAADRAVTVAPGDEWGHRLQAIALRHLGRVDQAVQAARRASALAPGSWATCATLAETLTMRRGRGDIAEAYPLALRAVEQAGERAPAWLTFGVVLAAAGNDAGARRAYRRAWELQPTLPAALNNVSIAEVARGRLVTGLRGLHEAWRHAPRHPLYRRNLAMVGYRAAIGLAGAGSLLCLLMAVVAASDPAPSIRLGVGLALSAGYLAACVALTARLLSIEPRLPTLAANRRLALGWVFSAAVPVQVLILVFLATWDGFLHGGAAALLAVPVFVALLTVESAIVAVIRRTVRYLRWRRLRATCNGSV